MAPSHFTDLGTEIQASLLAIARGSILHGLRHGVPIPVPDERLQGAAGEPRGSFVTLRQRSVLRGCVGTLEPRHPLAEAVAESAFNAAFRDTRFPALQEHELPATSIEISVLSPMEPLVAHSEEMLLRELEVGVDGLLLQEGWRRATFLPKVWEQLPEPVDFLNALRQKAGLPVRYWSRTLQFQRYRTISFSESAALSAAHG